VLRSGESGYPAALLDLDNPPRQLHFAGTIEALDGAPDRLVAIVGTRDPTPYGLRVTAQLARAFAVAGIGVVSGLARGIDAAAHRAAMEAGGWTIAVLGTGVDVPYPASHRELHGEIAREGLIVSECEPGTPAQKGCFPRRNRIIAALAKVTIVVEAPYKSGAVNTATQAFGLCRTVAAVPGPIDSARSAGSNLLLRDGAHVIATVDDALGFYGTVSRNDTVPIPALGELEAQVWDALSSGSASAEVLGMRTGLPVRHVLEGVARLELCGMVQQGTDGEVERLVMR
jgi:DNA processing protein